MQAAPLKAFPYLTLLRAEFGCFHSSDSPEISRSRNQDQSPGPSFCSTVPRLTTEGRYPLRCLTESGLSSPRTSLRASVRKSNVEVLTHHVIGRNLANSTAKYRDMAQSYALSAWFFVRALSLIYLIAFVSLAFQARGLFGPKGVLPIESYLKAVETQTDTNRYWQVPSIFWMNASDEAVVGVAVAGAVYAGLALIGFAQGWMLLLCFILYLSFVSTGQDFMSFQWDALLLEVGFLVLFAVPWKFQFELSVMEAPHWIVRGMFYVVLFKLMFLSGVVKLASGDEAWRDFSALSYHYWTQPLPNPLAPFVHQLPQWFHEISTVATFIVELLCPFLIFWPRTRTWAAFAFAALSVSILLTGNYTFFNWLTLALCIWLIPDSWWERIDLTPLSVMTFPPVASPHPFTTTMMSVLFLLSLMWCTRWFYSDSLLALLQPVTRVVSSLHVSSPYGLFAVMTKNRPEIVIEGSRDGQFWEEYEFKYKPGNLYRALPIVAPHQPRLDWQMWFAALGTFRANPWLQNLMAKLLENSPEVTALMDYNPFPNEPPKFLRARLYEYEFTSPEQIFSDGQWWQRKFKSEYSPTFTR